jgi:hypothetical protein
MRTRALFCLAGGSLGAGGCAPVEFHVEYESCHRPEGCTALGAAIGCCASVFIDVFVANHED